MWRSARAAWFAAFSLLLAVPEASAYEFEAKARTVGQGYTLHTLRLNGPDLRLVRRRISQSLQLNLWDIGGRKEGRSLFDPRPASGPRIYFSSYLRLDQDYGSYTTGQILLDGVLRDAIDAIPELERSSLQFDLLYGYLGAEGLLGGRFDVFAGRQMEVQTLDWFSMDGLKVRAHLPRDMQVELFGGLRVRESSPMGSDTMEPDGTSGALCEEYVEGAMPGSGAWRPIDGLVGGPRSPLTSDDELCPQRDELMPTYGAALATSLGGEVHARLAYRRSQSQRPGILGEVDRLDYPDRGYYPNEGQEPGKWGVNEERLSLSLRSIRKLSGGTQLVQYVAGRYSLLHGLLDEGHAGMRVAKHGHSLETELFHSVPTFDGDSIFNIFSSEPYTDARTSYAYAPREQPYSSYLRLWGRRYHSEDREEAEDPELVESNVYAAGLHAGARYRIARERSLRLDAFVEDGYGGLRAGGYLYSHWRWRETTSFNARLMAVRFDEDLRTDLKGYNLGAQLGATYLLNKGVAASLLIEQNSNRLDRFQLGAFAVIDLAFQPET